MYFYVVRSMVQFWTFFTTGLFFCQTPGSGPDLGVDFIFVTTTTGYNTTVICPGENSHPFQKEFGLQFFGNKIL